MLATQGKSSTNSLIFATKLKLWAPRITTDTVVLMGTCEGMSKAYHIIAIQPDTSMNMLHRKIEC